MEALVSVATGLRQPSPRCRLVVEARRIRLDFEELDEVIALLDAERPRCSIRIPETMVKVDVLPEGGVGLNQIAPHAVDEIARFTFSECRQVRRGKIKRHKGAP
ncbi:hypothetical protein KDX14_11970 [Burkholderia cenocepacia]|uniref:hypothetical protein n=1 Tax=Burkholderia cenocepacia TaxID=95486 RepID=UPI001BA07076|nr:hypothetical protein [Burkholderia cenocepacia]MBR8070222.1 hypothetical protein [Burkholderia cenocepacia]